MEYKIIDYLYIICTTSIWILLIINIILAFSGYAFYIKTINKKESFINNSKLPFISILIPAHNEEKVIYKTLKSMMNLNYPKEKLEVIVINDNSSDYTGLEIEKAINKYDKDKIIKVITTNKENGGKGKSSALNLGYNIANGEYICVYDADNNVEKDALKYLVSTITSNKLGAVIGKFRVRNSDKNILTRFINIETLSFQWIAQAGRWNLLKLCTIPGTNFIIKKDILDKIGGWDEKAISEDTELSFRIYRLGYKIGFNPKAVAWEQEPEKLNVWFKQRTRWAKGNIYVLMKHIKTIFKSKSLASFDIIYFFTVYFMFLSSVIISDIIFLICLFTDISISISGNILILWLLSYVLFILESFVSISLEKGEGNLKNILVISLMYFTYSQMWIIVVVYAFYEYLKDIIFKRDTKWYKTERF